MKHTNLLPDVFECFNAFGDFLQASLYLSWGDRGENGARGERDNQNVGWFLWTKNDPIPIPCNFRLSAMVYCVCYSAERH